MTSTAINNQLKHEIIFFPFFSMYLFPKQWFLFLRSYHFIEAIFRESHSVPSNWVINRNVNPKCITIVHQPSNSSIKQINDRTRTEKKHGEQMMRHDIYSLWQNWLQFCWNMQTHLVAPVTRIRWPDWKNVVTIPIFISHLKTLKLYFRYLIYGWKPLVWKLSSKKHQFRFHIQKKNNNDEVISELSAKERWASAHISTHTAFNIPLFHSNLLL